MALSVSKNFHGPIWPLGLVVVGTPGTPVNIMSLVDAANVNAPETKTSTLSYEYTQRAQQIIFQGYKAGSSHGLQNNTGQIYVVLKGIGVGSGNRDDYGVMVISIAAGQTFVLASAPLNKNVFNPYEFFVDADNAGDSCLVTLVVQ